MLALKGVLKPQDPSQDARLPVRRRKRSKRDPEDDPAGVLRLRSAWSAWR